MRLMLLIFVLTGGLLVALSVPLIRGKVPPNLLYGFRVKRTLEDPAVWYPANTYAAWRLLWLGVAVIGVALAAFFVPGLQATAYVVVLLIVLLGGLAVGVIRSFAYLSRIAGRTDRGGPTDDEARR